MKKKQNDYRFDAALSSVFRAQSRANSILEGFGNAIASGGPFTAILFEFGQAMVECACDLRAAEAILDSLQTGGLTEAMTLAAARRRDLQPLPADCMAKLVNNLTAGAYARFAKDGVL